MLIPEYKGFYERLILHSKRFIKDSCRLRGSFQRVLSGELDPRFLEDYRCYAITKSTKSLVGMYRLLEMGNYEDAIILSRTIFECYLSERYFDDKFDMETIRDMVIIPTAINEGYFIHRNGVVVRKDTKDIVEYKLRNPDILSLGKDKGYFYDFYYFLCQNAHCNISQANAFLDSHNDFIMYTEDNAGLAHFIGLFVFYKLFENTVLLESTRFSDSVEESECRDLLVELTTFLYDKLAVFCTTGRVGEYTADKETKKTARDMMNSLKEQLGRVDKGFVTLLEKQYIETPLEAKLKPVLLESEKPSAFFEDLKERKKLSPRYAELEKLIGIAQNPVYHPEGDVWTHTMEVLDRAAKLRDQVSDPFAFMLLALCHDLGKTVSTTVEEDGRIRSIGHEETGVPIAEKLLTRITNNDRTKQYVAEMIPLHMKPLIYAHDRSSQKVTDKLFARAIHPMDLILFAKADKNLSEEDEKFLLERYEDFLRRNQNQNL